MGPWWRDLFGGPWAEQRLLERKPPDLVAWEAAAIDRLLGPPRGLPEGFRVLDVPSGDGALCNALAVRRLRAHGVDLEPSLVRASRRRAEAARVNPGLVVGDMRYLPYRGVLDAVVCCFGSFGYFGDEGDAGVLRQIFEALRSGGRFVLDVPTTETLLPRFRPFTRTDIPGGWVEEVSLFRPATSSIESRWTMSRWGERHVTDSKIRLYSTGELVDLLSRCGFSPPRLHGSLAGEPFGPGSTRLVAVADKPALGWAPTP